MLAATTVFAQGTPASPPEKVAAQIGGKAISITYSAPSVKGRQGHIFTKDGLISHNPHYPVWRAGANARDYADDRRRLSDRQPYRPQGNLHAFCRYFRPRQLGVDLNKKTGEWGLAYDASADLGKVKMQMSSPQGMVEQLKYTINDLGGGKGTITLAWENHSASVPVSVH